MIGPVQRWVHTVFQVTPKLGTEAWYLQALEDAQHERLELIAELGLLRAQLARERCRSLPWRPMYHRPTH